MDAADAGAGGTGTAAGPGANGGAEEREREKSDEKMEVRCGCGCGDGRALEVEAPVSSPPTTPPGVGAAGPIIPPTASTRPPADSAVEERDLRSLVCS